MSRQALGRDLWFPLCPRQAAKPGRNLPEQKGCTLSPQKPQKRELLLVELESIDNVANVGDAVFKSVDG